MKRLVLIGLATMLVIQPTPVAHAAEGDRITIGRSFDGRVISAERVGAAEASTVVVIIGQMHGDERAGRRVVDALRRAALDADITMWLVPSMNPDGHHGARRSNARGVDLNRNFPMNWRRSATSGARAASEPETQAVMRWLTEVRPDAVFALHQPFGVVDLTHARSRPAGRALARWMGLPARPVGCSGPCRGTLTEWVDRELDAIALTVELPRTTTTSMIDRTADAITRLGGWLQARSGTNS